MKNIKLKDLFLGNIDGIKESEEKGFENYFYTGNNYYNKLKKNEKKFIISGKKGTGKTILAKYFELQENKEGKISKLLTERDPILKILIEIKTIDINPEERDLLTEYIIILEIANIINENRIKKLKGNTTIGILEKMNMIGNSGNGNENKKIAKLLEYIFSEETKIVNLSIKEKNKKLLEVIQKDGKPKTEQEIKKIKERYLKNNDKKRKRITYWDVEKFKLYKKAIEKKQ